MTDSGSDRAQATAGVSRAGRMDTLRPDPGSPPGENGPPPDAPPAERRKGGSRGHGGRDARVSAQEPDWSREMPRGFWDPSRRLLRAIRRYQAAVARPSVLGRLTRRWWSLEHRFWSVVTQAEIPLTARIGGGLLLPHPNGIVLHPDAEIGPNCLIFQQVTLGVGSGGPGLPRIGGHVDIGAGAKILGPVTVGDHAVIGANAVVVRNVPENSVAVGVPARLVPQSADPVGEDPARS
jgi:serine O-acetyltransferase